MRRGSDAIDRSAARGAEVRIEPVRRNGQARVALIGEIDLSNAREAEASLSEAAGCGPDLTLELTELTYLDSYGVAMVFRLARRARLGGATLTLVNPRDPVRRLLELMNVSAVATIHEDG